MDYMTEYQKDNQEDEPRYICEMCESKMDQRQVIPHLIGIKHRMKYFVSFYEIRIRKSIEVENGLQDHCAFHTLV